MNRPLKSPERSEMNDVCLYVCNHPMTISATAIKFKCFKEVESHGTSTFISNDNFTFNNAKLQHCYLAKKKLESKG